jgi:hypothetical protein
MTSPVRAAHELTFYRLPGTEGDKEGEHITLHVTYDEVEGDVSFNPCMTDTDGKILWDIAFDLTLSDVRKLVSFLNYVQVCVGEVRREARLESL